VTGAPWHDSEIVFKNDGSLARIQEILARRTTGRSSSLLHCRWLLRRRRLADTLISAFLRIGA
jgi:hypothetical protein